MIINCESRIGTAEFRGAVIASGGLVERSNFGSAVNRPDVGSSPSYRVTKKVTEQRNHPVNAEPREDASRSSRV